MEWWGWTAWAVTLIASGAGLVLGIRAELRARYLPLWVVLPDRVVNRTGEDAAQVLMFIEDDERLLGCWKESAVTPGDAIDVPEWAIGKEVTLTWIRPSSGKLYVWPWTLMSRWRARRIRRLVRGVRRRTWWRSLRRPALWPEERR